MKRERLEEKSGQANGLQAHGQQPVKSVEANSNAFIEFDQKPQFEKQFRNIPPETPKGEIQSPAEIKNNVIDFQTAQKNRLVN